MRYRFSLYALLISASVTDVVVVTGTEDQLFVETTTEDVVPLPEIVAGAITTHEKSGSRTNTRGTPPKGFDPVRVLYL